MNRSPPVREKPHDESGSDGMSRGSFDRLRNGGYERILWGKDLYISLLLVITLIVANWYSSIGVVNIQFISGGTSLAISLTAFILAALAVLVSFSNEKFLALLKELEIYNTLIVNFEFSIYLALITSIMGIIIDSYSDHLQSFGYLDEIFFIFVFFFIYMVLAAANLVSVIVSLGGRKAKLAMIENQ